MWLSRQKGRTVLRPEAGAFLVFEGRLGAPAGRDEGREVTPQITQGLVGHCGASGFAESVAVGRGLEKSHCEETQFNCV